MSVLSKEGSALHARSKIRHGADRFVQAEIGIPLWDDVYKEIFGPWLVVERDLEEWLDIRLGVDAALWNHSERGGAIFPLFLQEKTLGNNHGQTYDTLTVEYEQVANTGERKVLLANLYACGYLNEDETAISHGVVINWPLFLLSQPTWKFNQNRDGRAQASFVYIDIDDIPEEVVLWRRTK